MADIARDSASLALTGALAWVMWVECRRIRQKARQR